MTPEQYEIAKKSGHVSAIIHYARAEGYAAAREDAARVAENYDLGSIEGAAIADAIRALSVE